MKKAVLLSIGFAAFALSSLMSCAGGRNDQKIARDRLEVIQTSGQQWTGVAVSRDGRTFVNYPRWEMEVPVSVAEILETGEVVPYPNEEWNQWDGSLPPENHFVCVQSVFVDDDDFLWILDPANPWFAGVIERGPKLIQVDLSRNEIVEVFPFADTIALHGSYLNDVRVDAKRRFAYITDSGLGALVVLDLATGECRRVLVDDSSTKAQNIVLTIGGKAFLGPDSTKPQVHVDGLALDKEGDHVYYHALTARNLYRIESRWLRDTAMTDRERGSKVEYLAATGGCDGMIFGPDGDLYLTAIEQDAIQRYTKDRGIELVIQDTLLAWPDSFAAGPDGYLLVTTSQINVPPNQRGPYRLFRFKP